MILKFNRKIIFVIIIVILSANYNCITPIKVIKKKKEKFNNRKVAIKGRVISVVDLNDINTFTIKDRTGFITVVTKNYLPKRGETIKVKGVVKDKYRYSRNIMLVIVEKKIKYKQRGRLRIETKTGNRIKNKNN